MTIIYALLMFCVLIFIHEFGHFIAAKACGVKVNEFALGMGPAIFKKQKGDTLYALRAFPIGGYCAMEGEDEDSEDERAFNKKTWWQRAIIICAGAFMNLVLAVVIMACIAFVSGTLTTTIDTVQSGSPADLAGIVSGDTIIEIEGREVDEWADVYTFISESTGDTVAIKVMSEDGVVREVESGVMTAEDGRKIIGITASVERSFFGAIKAGVTDTWTLTISMFDILRQLFTGDVPASELSGPVGIVAVVNDTASLGFMYLLFLMAIISLNLAIMNMLPFPALDGGRLIFILIRAVTGKAITDEMEGRVHFIGIMCLFALMIYVTWNDILKFIVPIFQ